MRLSVKFEGVLMPHAIQRAVFKNANGNKTTIWLKEKRTENNGFEKEETYESYEIDEKLLKDSTFEKLEFSSVPAYLEFNGEMIPDLYYEDAPGRSPITYSAETAEEIAQITAVSIL